jgi:hypothetical protein
VEGVGGVWVVRSRENVLARAESLIGAIEQSVLLDAPAKAQLRLGEAVEQARRRGCRALVAAPYGFAPESSIRQLAKQASLADRRLARYEGRSVFALRNYGLR